MNNKPVILEIEELKKSLFDMVNITVREKSIPCYFIKPVIVELLNQVSLIAENEVTAVKSSQNESDDHE